VWKTSSLILNPFLLPEGKLVRAMVAHGEDTFLLAFHLQEVCNLPLDLHWPTYIGFLEFTASIHAASGKNSPPFEAVLKALQRIMEPCFNAVTSDSQLFHISGFPFLPLYDAHFPDITSGTWPDSAPDPEAFFPVLERLNGFV
jgi:hypothetical protein